MPRGDRTGPEGFGPQTGRSAGFCGGYPTPGYANSGMGSRTGPRMGSRMGFGQGQGRRNRFYATGVPGWQRSFSPPPLSKAEEADALKDQVEAMEENLKAARNRLAELEGE